MQKGTDPNVTGENINVPTVSTSVNTSKMSNSTVLLDAVSMTVEEMGSLTGTG